MDAYDDVRARLFVRLEGLTDDEYLWEPVPGGWSVRPGADGVFRAEKIEPDPAPAPFTTIAWRMWHIAVECLHVYVTTAFERVEIFEWPGAAAVWPGTAAEAVAALDAQFTRFRDQMSKLDDEALAGSAGPFAAELSVHTYGGLLLRALDESTHHGAEIGLLRDLYRHRPRARPPRRGHSCQYP
ncbi:hypothetical protein QR77_01975 [Streptomyces sp. 150FB]|nr:hypothetical protein QR77_01975 [Streptomyces sp. 150FB]